jgi:lipopolysaccharide biosynthesis regulator YciM
MKTSTYYKQYYAVNMAQCYLSLAKWHKDRGNHDARLHTIQQALRALTTYEALTKETQCTPQN